MASLSTQAAYERWAPWYPPFAHNRLMEVEQRAMEALLPALDGLVTLDAGCGTGRYLHVLHARGARRAVGIDASRAMLRQVSGAAVALAELERLPLASQSIDVAVSALAMNDVADLGPVMREIVRVLKPAGTFVFSALHPRGAEQRWARTFDARGETHSLPAHWHSLDAYRASCRDAGLIVDAEVEPDIDGRGPVALVMRGRR
jgi:malonyl-CoA O-methyltransferase